VTWDGTFDPGAFGPPGGSLELRNLRGVVSGRLGVVPLAAETLPVEVGRVVSVGTAPGLVDTHCHVVFGDYTPASMPSGSWRATCTAASPR
jgi:hypothetical protein